MNGDVVFQIKTAWARELLWGSSPCHLSLLAVVLSFMRLVGISGGFSVLGSDVETAPSRSGCVVSGLLWVQMNLGSRHASHVLLTNRVFPCSLCSGKFGLWFSSVGVEESSEVLCSFETCGPSSEQRMSLLGGDNAYYGWELLFNSLSLWKKKINGRIVSLRLPIGCLSNSMIAFWDCLIQHWFGLFNCQLGVICLGSAGYLQPHISCYISQKHIFKMCIINDTIKSR